MGTAEAEAQIRCGRGGAPRPFIKALRRHPGVVLGVDRTQILLGHGQ